MQIGLKFPRNEGGYKQAYTNNDIEVFKGEELFDNLVREIIQNALDALNSLKYQTVRVVFQLKYLKKDKHPVFQQYATCLKGCRRFWGDDIDAKLLRFLNEADTIIEKELIPVFVASDYYTKGLCGSRTRKNNDPWEACTNSDGVSAGKAETSGGSYGIGKNAPFACSGLSFVLYNTYAIDGEKAFTGVAKVATLYDDNNKQAQRIGKYQKYDDELQRYEPIYGEDECALRDEFARDEYGTDIVVTGFNQAMDWENNAKRAILKHFFVAIKEHLLVVDIVGESGTFSISADNIADLVSEYGHDKSMETTVQLYKAFVNPDKKVFLTIDKENDAELYIKADPTFGRNIANFRNTGMLVGQKSRRIFQHYAAVLIIRDKDLSSLLKDTEPPRHNRWDYKLITGEELKERRLKAKKCIELIDDQILQLLKNQFEVQTEDSADAEGVGEYLPDDVDEMGENGVGDDALKVKIKIGKMNVVKEHRNTVDTQAYKTTGTPMEGDVHNFEDNPNDIPPHPQPPKPIINVNDDKDGATKGNGSKKIIVPNMQAQRAFTVNASQGLYKIVFCPSDNYNNMYISCSALGEDGNTDDLIVEFAQMNGTNIRTSGKELGPLKVNAGVNYSIIVRFSSKEKMTLRLSMKEITK